MDNKNKDDQYFDRLLEKLNQQQKDLEQLKVENQELKKYVGYQKTVAQPENIKQPITQPETLRKEEPLPTVNKQVEHIKQPITQPETLRKEEPLPTVNKQAENIKQPIAQSETLHQANPLPIGNNQPKTVVKPIPYQSTQKNVEPTLNENSVAKITNMIGIIFLLLGVVFGLSYSYKYILNTAFAKSITAYVFGAILLILGEVYWHKKKFYYFSIGMLSAGIAVLFMTTSMTYFFFELIDNSTLFVLCIVIAVISLGLSLKHDSQLIAIFALSGAYLPIIFFSREHYVFITLIYFALAIFVILMATMIKDWLVLKYFALCYQFIGLVIFLISLNYELTPFIFIYILLTFSLYLGIIFIYPILHKKDLRVADLILLKMATVFSYILFYVLFEENALQDSTWLIALGYFAVFISMSFVAKKMLPAAIRTRTALILTSVVFILIATFSYFSGEYFEVIINIEALLLLGCAFKSKRPLYQNLAYSFFSLTFLVFISNNFSWGRVELTTLPCWKHLCITILFSALAFYQQKKKIKLGFADIFANVSMINLTFLIYSLSEFVTRKYFADYSSIFYLMLAGIISYLILLIFLKFAKALSDQTYLSFILLIFIMLTVNAGVNLIETIGHLEWLILIVFNILSLFMCVEFSKIIRQHKIFVAPINAVVFSFYSLILVTTFISGQFSFANKGIIISIIILLWSFFMTIHGFRSQFKLLRHSGLGLSLCAIAKLFLYDFFYTSELERIMSYLLFGILFIGISYAYQYFSKRLVSQDNNKKE